MRRTVVRAIVGNAVRAHPRCVGRMVGCVHLESVSEVSECVGDGGANCSDLTVIVDLSGDGGRGDDRGFGETSSDEAVRRCGAAIEEANPARLDEAIAATDAAIAQRVSESMQTVPECCDEDARVHRGCVRGEERHRRRQVRSFDLGLREYELGFRVGSGAVVLVQLAHDVLVHELRIPTDLAHGETSVTDVHARHRAQLAHERGGGETRHRLQARKVHRLEAQDAMRAEMLHKRKNNKNE